MSKKPKDKNIWWIVLLVLLFAPGLIKTAAKVALALLLPLGAIAIALAVAFGNDKRKKNAEHSPQKEADAAAQTKQAEQNEAIKKKKADEALKKKLKRLSCSRLFMVLAILCYAVCGLCGLAAAISAVEAKGSVAGLAVITLWFLASGAVLHLIAARRRNRARDAHRYLTLIGDKDSCSLLKLSSATSYKIDRVRRDLQRLIDDGIFGERAYIDMSEQCFMRTPEAIPDGISRQFGEYTRNMSSVGADVEKNAPSVVSNAEADSAEDLSDFAAILRRIRQLDDDILDESVSERIREIEDNTRNIFEYIEDKPEKMPQIRMFMNYYLPTTLKLLESYSRIERVGVAGQNMQEAKDNIEKILDMLVAGFRQQFDQLFKAESLDITCDIEVLEQMMKKDGLRDNDDFVIREETAQEILREFTDGYSDEISDDLAEDGSAAGERAK